jgi:hypothetical protein
MRHWSRMTHCDMDDLDFFCTAKLKARPVGLRSAAPDFRAYPEGTANPTSGFVSCGCLATELCRAAKSAAYRAALVVEEVWPHITKPQFVQRRFILTASTFKGRGPAIAKSPMRTTFVVLTTAIVVGSALAIMNNACKSAQHAWCAPASEFRHATSGSGLEHKG